MHKYILLILFIPVLLLGLEKLPERYRIAYGDPQSPIRITEYFSFFCPHCITLFREEFKAIKESFIDMNKVYWEFHPVPLDMPTVQAMICLEELTPEEKRIFLEVILEEADLDDSDLTARMMQKGMEVLSKPLPNLMAQDFVIKQRAYEEAFAFVKQEDHVEAIPTVEINGVLFSREIPELAFLKKKIAERTGGKDEKSQ